MTDTELLEGFFDYIGELTVKEFNDHTPKPVTVSFLTWRGMQLACSMKGCESFTFRDHLEGFFKKYPTKDDYEKENCFREWETDE